MAKNAKIKKNKLSIKWRMRIFDYRALDKRKATLESEINRDPFFTLGKELEQAEKSTAKNTPDRPLRVEFRETNIVCSTYTMSISKIH